jgi:hypothetical protein
MAYSSIEDKYLSALTAVQFPEEPPAPVMPEQTGAMGTMPGDIQLAEAGSRGLPQSAYSGQPAPAEMKSYDPTVRQRLASFLQAGFEGMGSNRYQARQDAQTILGGPSSNLPLDMGIADIIPYLGTALQTQEAGRAITEDAVGSVKAGNYGTAALQVGGGVLGLLPGAAGTIKAAKGLKNVPVGLSTEAVGGMEGVLQKPVLSKIEGGIKFPVDDSANRLRLKVQRDKQALEGKAMPGMPKNERTVIEAPEGSEMPNFVVGKITPDDWIERTEAILLPEEIAQYSKWYEEVRGTFLKYTDGDEVKTDKYMRAWLVANQNIGVDGAFNNVLLQAEQFARQVPAGEMKAAGLPLATKAARSALQDEPIVEGVGLKISDFVDSAEGKSVRSIYGNDALAGQPFVVDIHTARDTGLVDDILLNHLERQGYKVDRDRIATDLAGGPTDTQYENRADFGRKLTEHLNGINWQGRSDWQPKEVQAVGWMAMTRLTADAADDTVTALERSLRRISMEAAPGEGSPWATKYGAAFNALSGDRQSQLTKAVTERAMQMAKEISGIDLRGMVHGTGGWENYQNPAAIAQTLATRNGAEIAANTVGFLTQQTEVWVNSIKGTTKNPKALAIDFIESGSDNLSTNEGLRKFWEKVMAADPTKLFVGYQPIRTIDGEVGIRVLIDKGGPARMESVQGALSAGGEIDAMLTKLDYDVKTRGYEADLVKARNDWKGSKNGEAYLGRLAELGVKRTAADLDPLRSELEAIFERELAGAATPSASTSGTGAAANKTKTKIIGGPSSLVKGAE